MPRTSSARGFGVTTVGSVSEVVESRRQGVVVFPMVPWPRRLYANSGSLVLVKSCHDSEHLQVGMLRVVLAASLSCAIHLVSPCLKGALQVLDRRC
jgi:hypothetical protein